MHLEPEEKDLTHVMDRVDSQRSAACQVLRTRGLVRLRDLAKAGVAPETMARLVRDGVVVRPARGLYQLAGAVPDVQHALAEAAMMVPKGVVCLTSALQFHGLTLQMPSRVWMAIDRTGWKPRAGDLPLRFVRFGGRGLTDGVERHGIDGIAVPVFDPAKTVVDCFRYRNKIGLDIALEGLREGLRQRRITPDQLWRYAQTARAWSVMKPYVEAMVADGA